MKNTIWLASYPKSGNTWLRIIFDNLFNKKEVDLNNLMVSSISSSRYVIENCYGFDTALLTFDEIDLLRHDSDNYFAKNNKEITFRKCHDAYTYLPDGKPLLGSNGYHKAIYIIRNPLSVVCSLASHLDCTIDEAISHMEDEKYCFSTNTKKYNYQTRQKLLSWKSHVNSWINCDLETLFIKYEDLHIKPVETIINLTKFLSISFTIQEIELAIEKSSFNNISKKEKENGFVENPSNKNLFFRKGKINSWEEELSRIQYRRIVDYNSDLMLEFSYL